MDISAAFDMDVDDTPHGMKERRDSAVGLREMKIVEGQYTPMLVPFERV